MLYCPLLPYAGPVATARGIPAAAVVLKLAELQKTSRFVLEMFKASEIEQNISCVASAMQDFMACNSFCRIFCDEKGGFRT